MNLPIIFALLVNCQYTLQQFPTDLEEVSMTAAAGVSTNIEVTCGFEEDLGPVVWVINGTVHDLYTNDVCCIVRDGVYSIRIEMVPHYFNNTTFQCLSSTIHQPGRVLRLFAQTVPGFTLDECEGCGQLQGTDDDLEIDLQTLVTDSHHTKFQFNCNKSSDISLEVNKTNEISYIPQTCCEVNVSNSEISSNENITAFLLLVNLMGCNNGSRYITIYDHPTAKHHIVGNESLCIPLPNRTTQCVMQTIYLVISESCSRVSINPHPSTLKNTYGCQDFQLFNLTVVDSTNDLVMVCLDRWNLDFESIVVHFVCVPIALNVRQLVYHIISSHELIADTPLVPLSTDIIPTTLTTIIPTDESTTVPTTIIPTEESPTTISSSIISSTTTMSPTDHTHHTLGIALGSISAVVALLVAAAIAIILYVCCNNRKSVTLHTGEVNVKDGDPHAKEGDGLDDGERKVEDNPSHSREDEVDNTDLCTGEGDVENGASDAEKHDVPS